MFVFAISFVFALFVGTLAEYWLHRCIHELGFFYKKHWEHHKNNNGDNWILDFFFFYLPKALPMLLLGLPLLFLGWYLFLGWFVGGIFYVLLFSICHHVHHLHPKWIFWMKVPIHHHHHLHYKGCYNYGVVVDWWDKVFGTYRIY